ncbi:hypothetical protein OCH239_18505 [Roseivivax halodurans JCM 10272]|uniref:Uncharacterized protein n=1 Tax=Roseivivax halodurans JCM 10272 TaxID=1449350 RepID=X7EH80_9RHOB|nr:hypothetical protein OCH239_18505 [Roseivivax halodurans JCM 10272]
MLKGVIDNPLAFISQHITEFNFPSRFLQNFLNSTDATLQLWYRSKFSLYISIKLLDFSPRLDKNNATSLCIIVKAEPVGEVIFMHSAASWAHNFSFA